MKRLIVFIALIAAPLFPQQKSNLFDAIPNATDSATGEFRLFELRSNGSNYFSFKAPSSLSGNILVTPFLSLPAKPECVTLSSAGQMSTSPCANTTACEVVIGDPASSSPILVDDNDAPSVCANVSGGVMDIIGVACYANAGSPVVNPIITGGGSTSLLSSPLTCGTGSYATGTLSGSPTLSNGSTIDANISTAGGVAKYIVVRITRRIN